MLTVALHPAVVHFPIALLLVGSAAALLHIYGPRRRDLATCSWWLLLLGWIGTLAAILSGLLAQSGLPPRAPYRSVLNWHIGTGMAVALVYGALLYLWWLRRARSGARPLLDDASARLWVTVLLLLGMLLVIASGWSGGSLVYEWGVNVGQI
jgi:uncharacterized membrane protein